MGFSEKWKVESGKWKVETTYYLRLGNFHHLCRITYF
jgi:hypothetical protein